MPGETESGNPLVKLETGSYTACNVHLLLAVYTTAATANLPEFNLGARTHKTSINKIIQHNEEMVVPYWPSLFSELDYWTGLLDSRKLPLGGERNTNAQS